MHSGATWVQPRQIILTIRICIMTQVHPGKILSSIRLCIMEQCKNYILIKSLIKISKMLTITACSHGFEFLST